MRNLLLDILTTCIQPVPNVQYAVKLHKISGGVWLQQSLMTEEEEEG